MPLQTEEQIMLIREHIILNVMLQVLPVEARNLRRAGTKIAGSLFAQRLEEIMDDVIRKLTDNRRDLKRVDVRIVEKIIGKTGARAVYLYSGGYEAEMELLPDLLKAETSIRLAEAFGFDLTMDENEDE